MPAIIEGIGIDLIEVARVTEAINRWGERFLKRVYTPVELAYCLPKALPAPHLAARLAAKEAAYKALASSGFSWRDFWVESEGNVPRLLCSPKVLLSRPGLSFLVSISHTREHAVAVVRAQWEAVQDNADS